MADMNHIPLNFENRFSHLPDIFYTRMSAEGFSSAPYLIHANAQAARLIDLNSDAFALPEFPLYFSGNMTLPGAKPLAMVYAGHQFGHYVPQLGDGRALLLGQIRNQQGELWDIQLKGSGQTPYSRFADGRAVLRSCIREYLCGEALNALDIPTTRALCVVGSGEKVQRETLEPGAILTRLAQSHIRFGNFEYFYHSGQHEAVAQLADHVIEIYFSSLKDSFDRYLLWYEEIARRTARLMAQWMACGFSHGVMNTDNMSILGLTIDYGPFGFMERFDPHFICNHSDVQGRYAYDQQPGIARWNLLALAYALQPVLPYEASKEIIVQYSSWFFETYNQIMARKLGFTETIKGDDEIWRDLLLLLQKHELDYTLAFRGLSEISNNDDEKEWLGQFGDSSEAMTWYNNWSQRFGKGNQTESRRKRMLSANPKYILRNWVAETAIRAAEDRHDYSILDQILKILQSPYDEHPAYASYAALPPENMKQLCVSCSS